MVGRATSFLDPLVLFIAFAKKLRLKESIKEALVSLVILDIPDSLSDIDIKLDLKEAFSGICSSGCTLSHFVVAEESLLSCSVLLTAISAEICSFGSWYLFLDFSEELATLLLSLPLLPFDGPFAACIRGDVPLACRMV